MKPRQIIEQYETLQVEKDLQTGQQSLHARISFQPGEIISFFSAESIHEEPTYLTVQKDDKIHITLQPSFLQYCNHSCEPNSFFDCDTMQFICLSPVVAGDELSFFYPSSEWRMAQPFSCYCGKDKCLGVISGAENIPEEILKTYRLTGFIERKLKEKNRKVA